MSQAENKAKIVRNASKAYGYNYASLADIARDGIQIPKMRVRPVDGQDYIEYFDGTDWQLGAKVVVPANNKGMNEAQAYGAALTYARRYTVQLAEALVCDDDAKFEAQAPSRAAAYRQQAAQSNLVVDDGKTPVAQAGAVSSAQQNFIRTLLAREYKMEWKEADETVAKLLKTKITGSREASAFIKSLQANVPLDELLGE